MAFPNAPNIPTKLYHLPNNYRRTVLGPLAVPQYGVAQPPPAGVGRRLVPIRIGMRAFAYAFIQP